MKALWDLINWTAAVFKNKPPQKIFITHFKLSVYEYQARAHTCGCVLQIPHRHIEMPQQSSWLVVVLCLDGPFN